MHKKKRYWKSTIWSAVVVFIITLVYSVVRYNIFKGVAWVQLPLWVNNKAISLSAVILIGISFTIGPMAWWWPRKFKKLLPLRKHFGLAGFGLGAAHALISLLLFTPENYGKFFDNGKLNLTGELSMLFGVLAFFIFAIVAITSFPSIEKKMKNYQWLTIQRLGYAAFFFVLLHVLVMGLEGWLKPEGWPGGLLPISLVAFIVIAIVLLVRTIAIIFPGRK